MLKVLTKVSESTLPGAGKGLFAAEFIPKGEVVWEFDPEIDKTTSDDEFKKMSEQDRKKFSRHAYFSKIIGLWIMCGDNAIFMNHSESPNLIPESTGENSEDRDLAAVDINTGDEIFCNYFDFDIDASRKLSMSP
jgi:uncharacterized protein